MEENKLFASMELLLRSSSSELGIVVILISKQVRVIMADAATVDACTDRMDRSMNLFEYIVVKNRCREKLVTLDAIVFN